PFIYDRSSKRMKRGSAKIQALASRETALISARFMFRFTVPLVARERFCEQQRTSFVRPFSLLFWRFRGGAGFETLTSARQAFSLLQRASQNAGRRAAGPTRATVSAHRS